jgi:iron complex transport system ATP-binding protein
VSVETLVGYGRTPHLPFLKRPGKEDEEATLRAMDISGVTEFRKRALSSLSGGQLQRVWIAMALAQDTDLLLLDEPTTWLDVRYQIEILKLIRRLNEAHGITIALILHDINQAIYYSDEIIGLKNGKVVGRGSPDEIITDEFISDIYGLRLETVRVNKRDFVLQI